MSTPGPFAEIAGRLAYEFAKVQPLIPTYLHLIISALFPIYIGARASLSRPSSAAKPTKRHKHKHAEDDDALLSSDDEEEDKVKRMEGLSPSDAILFPLMAGCTLAGLYFLIKWLKDPAILNKILNWYFAVFGVYSVSSLIADALQYVHSLVFPRMYVYRGTLWRVRGREREAVAMSGEHKDKEVKHSPLPGALSGLPLPAGVISLLWTLRNLFGQKWIIKVYIHRIVAVRGHIRLYGVLGLVLGISAVLYFNLVAKPWWLTNLMGFGFAYGALQLMSPTTFATGSLILGALFLYDIYFVFFTPMMVTVAKSLDIPIKLIFPRPGGPDADPAIQEHAMLGLGDVVLPGIMIGLALRFDLYLFYLKKQVSTGAASKEVEANKANYVSVSGRWGDNFWTQSWLGRSLLPNSFAHSATDFPKPYFYAAMAGYVVGMLVTLAVMQVFGHAQPALLYLVPGVLIAVWGTALVRGEIKQMWEFSEATEEHEDDAKAKEKKETTDGKAQNGSVHSMSTRSRDKEIEDAAYAGNTNGDVAIRPSSVHDGSKKPSGNRAASSSHEQHDIISFSISSPTPLKEPSHDVKKVLDETESRSSSSSDSDAGQTSRSKPRWKSPGKRRKDGEPARKRQRAA